jgi:hypothetical protein
MSREKEEATRYDRQVRLWGAAAQQRLQTTRVRINGLNGLTSEIAKTLILAGVKSVVLADPSRRSCTPVDFSTNHFVYQLDVDTSRTLEEALAARLGELNPFVGVTAEGRINSCSEEGSTPCEYAVTVVRSMDEITSLAAAHDNAPSTSVQTLVVVTMWDAWTLGVFLERGTAAATVSKLFSLDSLSAAPRPFQLCALRLYAEASPWFASGAPFTAALRGLDGVVEQLSLQAVSDDDIQHLLDASRGQFGSAVDTLGLVTPLEASISSIACTVGGGFIAQQIIARASSGGGIGATNTKSASDEPPKSAGSQQPLFGWIATSTPLGGDETECFVG